MPTQLAGRDVPAKEELAGRGDAVALRMDADAQAGATATVTANATLRPTTSRHER